VRACMRACTRARTALAVEVSCVWPLRNRTPQVRAALLKYVRTLCQGEWRDDLPNGRGVFALPAGEVYDGSFRVTPASVPLTSFCLGVILQQHALPLVATKTVVWIMRTACIALRKHRDAAADGLWLRVYAGGQNAWQGCDAVAARENIFRG
jgi:hypothetical protein